tara:strand:- start:249 stop:1115 length:867 start_codon:yes stop_codon:yes gene_type:complete
MKYTKYLFLILSIIFVFEMVNSNHAEACTVTAGVVAKESGDGADFIDDGCDETPALYEVVIYKLYLCTSSPTEATTSSSVVLTPCSQVFNSSSGATASVIQGADIVLDGTYTRPPEGTYTHGYAFMDNTFGITWAGQLSASMTGMTGGTGVFCGTVAGSGTHAKGSTHTNSSVCGSSAITAGKFVETLAQFGGSGDTFSSKAEVDNINGTSAAINGYLVDTNGHRASTTGEVDKLEGLVSFANPVVVTADTTFLSMKFNVGEGMHLVNGGSNKLFIGSGPFQAIMTAN